MSDALPVSTPLTCCPRQELQRQRSLVERLRSDAQELDWQRQAASEEVQMSADAGTRLRVRRTADDDECITENPR